MVKRVPIETYCEKKISTLQKNAIGMIDYIDISSVDNIKKKIISFQTMNAKDAPSRAKQLLKKYDILVSTVRPNLNAVAVVESETDNLMVGSTGYCVLRCKDNMDFRYLFNFCQSQYFIDDMSSQATGASYPAVSTAIVRSSLIPNYPVDDQRRIASELDKITDLIDKRKEQLEKLDALVKARFVELFGDPVKNDMGWESKPLNEVCDGIGDGLHGTPVYDDGGDYPFINGNNLIDGKIVITPATKMVSEETYMKHFIDISTNAILISINGTLGKLAFYNGEKVMLGKSACYCNLKQNINKVFVYGVMKSDSFAEFLDNSSTKSTIKNVGLKAMREYKLILPPTELKEQFTAFVEQTDKSKLEVQKSLEKLELLKKALMQKYFG